MNNPTVEKINGQYDLVIVATTRARDIKKGVKPLVNNGHGAIVTALEEIDAGLIGYEYLKNYNHDLF